MCCTDEHVGPSPRSNLEPGVAGQVAILAFGVVVLLHRWTVRAVELTLGETLSYGMTRSITRTAQAIALPATTSQEPPERVELEVVNVERSG